MNKLKVAIINLNISNIGSIKRVVSKLNHQTIVTDSILDLNKSTHIILPGVGSFNKGMETLKKLRLYDDLYSLLEIKKKPFLGICLGMQLLGSIGFENDKEEQGLGIIEGTVNKLEKKNKNIKIPHIGWNGVSQNQKDKLFHNIEDNSDFYFIHSFHLKPNDDSQIISYTNHGQNFVSSVRKDNIYGVQFHPEKSMKCGINLFCNFFKMNA